MEYMLYFYKKEIHKQRTILLKNRKRTSQNTGYELMTSYDNNEK